MLDSIDKKMAMLECFLSDYQIACLEDCMTGFGRNDDTINTMIYVWFGMEYDAFIDYCIGDDYDA